MKLKLIEILLKLLVWAGHEFPKPPAPAPVPAPQYILPDIPDAVMESARTLTAQHASMDASGEWKRHQVYASLIKRHPDASTRLLALAIEVALCSE